MTPRPSPLCARCSTPLERPIHPRRLCSACAKPSPVVIFTFNGDPSAVIDALIRGEGIDGDQPPGSGRRILLDGLRDLLRGDPPEPEEPEEPWSADDRAWRGS